MDQILDDIASQSHIVWLCFFMSSCVYCVSDFLFFDFLNIKENIYPNFLNYQCVIRAINS